jgi:uncharacterized protein YcnI
MTPGRFASRSNYVEETMFKKIARTCAPVAVVLALAAPAAAHVTVQPNEAVQGSFSRFVVRVPNEKPDEGTIKIEVRLPALAFVSFEPKEGWERKETTGKFDEPIEAFGEELTEGITSVVWSGGRIGPGEFLEFGFSAKMPDEETTLTFEALQTYEGGEVVKWTGAPDSDAPAALVKTYDIGAAEGEGQLGVLARLADGNADSDEEPAAEEPSEDPAEPDTAAPVADDDGDDDGETMPLLLSGGAFVLALAALVLALKRR